jgi:adenosylcobinamide kinase / adenosylcobinamide-phosphate guanylyltransferase
MTILRVMTFSSATLPPLTLVLGGARSGKSRYGEALVSSLKPPWIYLATAQAFDAEMDARIAEHRARRGVEWVTRDAPIDVPAAILSSPKGQPVLIDCLTLWLTNLMLADHDIEAWTLKLLDCLGKAPGPVVMISNEVGLGIVPENALARRFRDEAGRLHQRLAAKANTVILMVAGLPITAKG